MAGQKNGPQALGRARGGLSTKIHSLVEGLGQLARWTLTGGQRHDLPSTQALIEGLPIEVVVADKAYAADALIAAIERGGALAVIPPKSNCLTPREFDRHPYKHRNLVERFFCRIKRLPSYRVAIRQARQSLLRVHRARR